jgi:uncharacterized protein (DUF1697 family)
MRPKASLKAPNRHVALLRGINVGGNDIIKMVALKASFEAMGFTDVVTYIQSGNVLFSSTSSNAAKLTKRIEVAPSETFGYASVVVLLSAEELARVVDEAPPKFGAARLQEHHDSKLEHDDEAARPRLAYRAMTTGGITTIGGVVGTHVHTGGGPKVHLTFSPGKQYFESSSLLSSL